MAKPLLKEDTVGRWGEDTAFNYLVSHGIAIIERNWKMGHYEIDIVAQDGKYIVFVEVKTRKSATDDPVKAVNKAKRARMIASANVYMQQYDVPLEYRFDIVAITGDKDKFTVEHIPDAFLPPLKRFNYSFRL